MNYSELAMIALLFTMVFALPYLLWLRQTTNSKQLFITSKVANISLYKFLNLLPSKRELGTRHRFYEQSVRSLEHKLVGRFDSAVFHWSANGPVLDMIIEYKFPVRFIPQKAYSHDMFQTGLYALALADLGVITNNTRLVVLYCLQGVARKCLKSRRHGCSLCGRGRIFVNSFKRVKIIKALERLDQVWSELRSPKAGPSKSRCIACPYSRGNGCKYSAV